MDTRLDELEKQLRTSERGVLVKFSDRIKRIEDKRPWLVAIGVIGAMIAALSRVPTGDVGILMAIIGGFVAGVSGLMVAIFDYRKLELGADLSRTEQIAEDALAEARRIDSSLSTEKRKLARDLEAMEAAFNERITHRRSTLLALEHMNTAAQLSGLETPPAVVIEAMLDTALPHIVDAFHFEGGEHWTISIFSREIVKGKEVMHRRISRWWNRKAENEDLRDWCRDEGFTGYAWNHSDDVIEPDTGDPAIAHIYKVPKTKRMDEDAKEFVSVAAIPIKVGADEKIAGVVTVSSNRKNQFLRDQTHPRAQNVDLVRQIQAIIAVQVALRQVASKGSFILE